MTSKAQKAEYDRERYEAKKAENPNFNRDRYDPEYTRKYYAANKDYFRGRYLNQIEKNPNYGSENRRKAFEKNPDHRREWVKRRVAADPLFYRRRHLRHKFDLSVNDFDRMIADQGGRCATCLATEAGGRSGVWHIDHCHTTGKIRGLLCLKCNAALGQIQDSIETLARMIEYLKFHSK